MADTIYKNVTNKTVNGVAPGGQIKSSDNNQELSNKGFAWVGPAGSDSADSGSTDRSSGSYDPYKLMTLDKANREANKAFSGMQSPMTMDQIRAREEEAQELGRETAGAVYDPKIDRSEALGRGEMSTTRGAVGQGSGFNLSTAEMTFLNNTQSEVQSRTKEIVDTKANYISQGDFAAAERADKQIASLREYENQLVMAKANYALQLMSGDREAANAILNQQKFGFEQYATERQLDQSDISMLMEIPEGESFTYNGVTYNGLGKSSVDPFFKSSDIVSLMKSIPAGIQETVVDPNTGREYNISGLGDDPNIKVITSENSAGEMTITKYDITTGEVISQVSGGKVGRSGSAGTSVTLDMAKNEAGQRLAITDKNGNQIGYQAYNDYLGKVQNYRLNGTLMDTLPEGVQIKPFGSSSEGNWFDNLDTSIF